MRKRSTEILQRLFHQPDGSLNIQKLAEDYRISEKTLKNDLTEILCFVRECGMEKAVICDSHFIMLYEPQKMRQLEKMVYSMAPYNYKLSLEERKFYIIITLLRSNGYYSMQQLADEMYVTRNTIINDCKVVREYLEEFGIVFISRNNKGIKIEETLEQEKNLLIHIFRSLLVSLSCEKDFFVCYLSKKLGFQYKLNQIASWMSAFAKKKDIIFAKEVFLEITVCLYVLLNDKKTSAENEEKSCRNISGSDLELDVIGEMICYVAEHVGNIVWSKEQILHVEQIILGRNINPDIQSINDFELYGVISHFLLELGKETHTDIQNDDLLIKSLISHIKSMKNWSTLEFDMDEEYEEFDLFIKVKAVSEDKFYLLENYLHYDLDSNMKDSIIIHICAAILRNRQRLRPCNVIVSCPGSMATSKYLEAQIKNYFNLNVVRVMSTKQVKMLGSCLEDVDFVVSTVDIPNCPAPVATVSPLLTIEDINKIQGFMIRHSQQEMVLEEDNQTLLSQIHSVYMTGDSKKIAYLNSTLKQVLAEVQRIESETAEKSALLNMLKLEYVKKTSRTLEWRQGMKEAAADLVRDGYFDTSYVEKAIENVEEYGTYIIVNRGIALAHANKDAGVYEDGIGLLVAENGIWFEDGDPVYLLFFFSQKGDTDYLELFKEIIKIGNDQKNIEKMRGLDSAKEIYQLIIEILTEY